MTELVEDEDKKELVLVGSGDTDARTVEKEE